MKLERYPVVERMPGCYTLHRGDGRCAACPHQPACARATEANAGRRTVGEAAAAAVSAWRAAREADTESVYPEDLVLAAAAGFRARGGEARGWASRPDWVRAMEVVLAACRAAGWDARTYVRAQVETVGWMCAEKGFALRPANFLGRGAAARFERWAERNARRHGDARVDRHADDGREQLLAGECCFAERYFAGPGFTEDEAEAFARASFGVWTLASTASRPDVRLPALVGALASLDRGLPHRMLAPAGAWTWPEARAAALALYTLEDPADEQPLDLDPDLGVML